MKRQHPTDHNMFWCPKCGTYKARKEFGRSSSSKHGVQSHCRKCKEIKNKKRIGRRRHPANADLFWCPDCKTYKTYFQFYSSKRNLNGLSTYCKVCTNRRAEIRTESYPERVKEQHNRSNKKYRENNRGEINAKNRIYSASLDREIQNQKQREYRTKNRDKVNARKRRYVEVNRIKINRQAAEQQMRKRRGMGVPPRKVLTAIQRREAERKRSQAWKNENIDYVNQQAIKWRKEHPDNVKKTSKKTYLKHRDKRISEATNRMQLAVNSLSDEYIRRLLKARGLHINIESIELERQQLSMKRTLNQLRKWREENEPDREHGEGKQRKDEENHERGVSS